MIKNLLFDCSDTLLRLHCKADLANLLGDPERAERIHNAFFRSETWGKYDNGLLTDEEMKSEILPLLDPADRAVAEEYIDNFTDHYTPIEGMLELLSELKDKGYRLFIVSDFPPRFLRLWETYEIFRLFDGRAVSFEVHGSKRDHRLFSYVLEHYGLDPAECLFVDDVAALVANAKIYGIDGHVFSDAETLRADLKRRAVL